MSPGTLVRRSKDGAVGRVVDLEDDGETLVVEVNEEKRRVGRQVVPLYRSGTGAARALAPE